jgi:predicted negative regulator of RcsB-dependent stress response
MAIDDLLDEHEQGERVRSWLRNNGAAVLTGILVAVILLLGWQWWQKQRQMQLFEAYTEYQAVLSSITSKDLDKAAKEVAQLEAGKSSIYQAIAALRLAKAQSEAGKGADAIKTLRGVPQNSELAAVVGQRLARLLIEAGQPEDAAKLLDGRDDDVSLEIRGDALVAQGKREQAREIYTKALATVDVASPQRRLLETKLMDVGGTPPDPAEPI